MTKKVLCLLLVLSVLLFGCEQPEKVLITDLVIGELEGSEHAVSFFVTNQGWESNDCQAKITINNNLHGIYDLGIITPNEKAFFETTLNFENGKISLDIAADCRPATQKEIKACGSEKGAKRRICMLTLDKPRLQQCITDDITRYNFFCIALLNKEPEVCDYLSLNKRVWCKAYVTNNAGMCATVRDENGRNWCYANIGINYQDKGLCEKITDKKSKTSCTAATTQNPELCLEGEETLKISCVANIAEATGKKDLCNLLEGEQKQKCAELLK